MTSVCNNRTSIDRLRAGISLGSFEGIVVSRRDVLGGGWGAVNANFSRSLLSDMVPLLPSCGENVNNKPKDGRSKPGPIDDIPACSLEQEHLEWTDQRAKLTGMRSGKTSMGGRLRRLNAEWV